MQRKPQRRLHPRGHRRRPEVSPPRRVLRAPLRPPVPPLRLPLYPLRPARPAVSPNPRV